MIPWLLIPVGILMVVYTKPIVDFTGEFPFAEKYFLSGGTYSFIKLLGVMTTVFSFMWITGGLQLVLKSFFGPFFGIH